MKRSRSKVADAGDAADDNSAIMQQFQIESSTSSAMTVAHDSDTQVVEFMDQEQQQQQQQQHVQEKEEIEGDGTLPQLMQDDFEDLEEEGEGGSKLRGKLTERVDSLRSSLTKVLPKLKIGLAVISLLGYVAYFCYAMYNERLQTDGSVRLLALTCCVVVGVALNWLLSLKSVKESLQDWSGRMGKFQQRHLRALSIGGRLFFVLYFFGLTIGIGAQNLRNLVSVAGLTAIIFLAIIFSAHPTKINWRPVMGGLTLQVTLGVLLIRTEVGFQSFKYLSDRVAEFITHVDAGSKFVFGDSFADHYFAFSVLPVIVFFSSFIALMFHLNILQSVISVLGKLMQVAMGTTAGESLVAAANIFIGQTEAPLLIRPIAGRMTNSELHSVITSGYATIAGGVMAAYIGIGVPANDLLSASVMAAPAALALSKIMYPETKKSKTDSESVGKIKMGSYHNAIDALATGAVDSISLVAAIAANLIAFVTMLTFVNATLTWIGGRIGLPVDLTFELICGYALWPIAFLIGVEPVDCENVAELVGTKFFINEFIAYERFNVMRENHLKFRGLNITEFQYNKTALWFNGTNSVLTGGILFSERSISLVTYALCGFANIGSIGMQLGMFCILLPNRKSEIVPLILRGVVTGTMANLLTACVAGIFYEPTVADTFVQLAEDSFVG